MTIHFCLNQYCPAKPLLYVLSFKFQAFVIISSKYSSFSINAPTFLQYSINSLSSILPSRAFLSIKEQCSSNVSRNSYRTSCSVLWPYLTSGCSFALYTPSMSRKSTTPDPSLSSFLNALITSSLLNQFMSPATAYISSSQLISPSLFKSNKSNNARHSS